MPQYILTEKEYRELQQAPNAASLREKRHFDNLRLLYLQDTKQGCIHDEDNRIPYCDGCRVRHYCGVNKEYSR